MNILLHSVEMDALKDVPAVKKFLEYNSWNAKRSMKLDLATLSNDSLNKVIKVLNEMNSRRSLNVIKQYCQAIDNPQNFKPKTLDQFATMLKSFLSTAPKYYLFTQSGDGDFLPYVISNLGYQPPVRRSGGVSPAYVFIHMKYYEHGNIKSTSVNFYANQIKDKTCSQILDASGYIMGTQEMISAYEADTEKYKKYRSAVGLQVLGAGEAQVIGEEKSWYGGKYKTLNSIELAPDGRKSRLVVDDQDETEEEDRRGRGEKAEVPLIDGKFWKSKAVARDDDSDDSDDTEISDDTELQLEVPLHPTVLCFHLEKHLQLYTHVNRLEEYVYDKTLGEKLVLPDFQKSLIEILVQRDRAEFQDIIKGKAGGSIVLCSGQPGTGKTLTAEVFAEHICRPLYVVQSAQLGVSAEELEGSLVKVLSRALRWGAILLIDEADVFIRTRGDDINQNAIVGCFLRVLEYYNGTLFMTTNRGTTVDDAIISRTTAQVKFEIPTQEGQARIWRILADASGIKLPDAEIKKFSKKHAGLSGRDVKGLLKLANMVAVKHGKPVTAESIESIMVFKPTAEALQEK